eukprot:2075246-Amphidinium_carterae.1
MSCPGSHHMCNVFRIPWNPLVSTLLGQLPWNPLVSTLLGQQCTMLGKSSFRFLEQENLVVLLRE